MLGYLTFTICGSTQSDGVSGRSCNFVAGIGQRDVACLGLLQKIHDSFGSSQIFQHSNNIHSRLQ